MPRTLMLLGVIAVVAVLTSGSGCQGEEGEDLVGTWEIDINSFGGFDTTYADVMLQVEFLDDMQLRGFSACNNFTGTYEVPGAGQVEMGSLASTRKACPEDFMTAENEFLLVLDRAARYEVSGGVLHLRDVNGQELVALHSAGGGASPH